MERSQPGGSRRSGSHVATSWICCCTQRDSSTKEGTNARAPRRTAWLKEHLLNAKLATAVLIRL